MIDPDVMLDQEIVEYEYLDTVSLNKCFMSDVKYSDLLILSVNIRSIDQNFDRLLTHLALLSTKPDIIVCTETRILDNHYLYNISGYNNYYNQSMHNQNDGVLIYINNF